MRLPYPRWIYIGDLAKPSSIDEAIGILAGFSAQIEVHKVLTLSRYISSSGLGWDHIQKVYDVVFRDLGHLSLLSLFGDPLKPLARGSPDLDYALGSIAEIADPGLALSITLSAVVPAYIAILEFIVRRTPLERVRKAFSEILEGEMRDLEELLRILSNRFRGGEAAEALEERAVVLFASAGAEDALKVSIASIASGSILDEVASNKVLGDLYRSIDGARKHAAEKLYVDSNAVVATISRYGLSGLALC